jgi:Cu/Ag efflux protein CusF
MTIRSINGSLALILTLILTVALFTAVPGAVYAAGHGSHSSGHAAPQPGPETTRIYTTTGVLNSVDKAAGKLSITHEPVPALGWPAMTMRFSVEDAALLEGVKPGDKLRFDFRPQGSGFVIVDMETRN